MVGRLLGLLEQLFVGFARRTRLDTPWLSRLDPLKIHGAANPAPFSDRT
jgi:hypothetical protein